MKTKKNIIIDFCMFSIILSFFIVITILKSFRVELLIFLLIYFGIVFSSYIPFMWNIPVDIDNLNNDAKIKILEIMHIFILFIKIDYFSIYVVACVSILYNLELIFFIVLIIGVVLFGISCIYTVHKIIKLSNKEENKNNY